MILVPSKEIKEPSPKDGWKTLKIRERRDPLVALGPFTRYSRIAGVDPIYFGGTNSSPYKEGELPGSLLTVFVRSGVADRLEKVANRLASKKMMLLVWDAYRSIQTQASLYNWYVNKLVAEGQSEAEAKVNAQTFVSVPSTDPSRPSPHNTGGAVDLTIIQFTPSAWAEMQRLNQIVDGKEGDDFDEPEAYRAEMRRLQLIREATPLDMGTMFDEVAPATALTYFEKATTTEDKVIRDNRRLLHSVMSRFGFTPYGEEWWHWDYGNQFWAKGKGGSTVAFYGAADFSQECQKHENMRLAHLRGSTLWSTMDETTFAQSTPTLGKLGEDSHLRELRRLVREVGRSTGSFYQNNYPQACVL